MNNMFEYDLSELKQALLKVAIVCAQNGCFDCPFADNIGCPIGRPRHWRVTALLSGGAENVKTH